MTGSPGIDLEVSARLLGGYAWLEERCFEVLGRASGRLADPRVQAFLGTQARHHAWHAELWRQHLPVWGGPGPGELVAPAHPALVELVAALEPADAPDPALALLVGMYRVVVPAKVVAYTAHLATTTPLADAPVMRSLRFALQDEHEGWGEGEALIQSRSTGAGVVEAAASHQVVVQKLLAQAGGVTGGLLAG